MQKNVILDTGVLIAFLMPRDKHHHWAVSSLQAAKYPVLTCEAVLTEACIKKFL
jgi:predicted nucleic acid-binding protein